MKHWTFERKRKKKITRKTKTENIKNYIINVNV